MKKIILIAIITAVLIGGAVWVLAMNESENPAPNSAEGAPEGSIHNLPLPTAVAAVRKYVAQGTQLEENQVVILEAIEREWSDACLGLGATDQFCAQVITPGYRVKVIARGQESVYRTNMDGSLILAE